MSKHYLVTGGSGFLGSALVRQLVRKGHKVRVFDNNSRGSVHRLKEVMDDIEFVEGDIRDYSSVVKACQGVDSIYHLAFVNGTEFFYSKPELVLDVGVKGMVHVLDAAKEVGIGDIVVASSSEVYQSPSVIPTPETVPLIIPDPKNPRYSYAMGKILSEVMTLQYGPKYFDRVCIFRPHNVYGPDMGWEHVIPQFAMRMKELLKEKDWPKSEEVPFPIQGNGQETRAFIYVDDFIDGLILVGDKGENQEIYHIGTEEEVTIETLAIQVGRYFDRDIKIQPGDLQQGSTPRRCPDISKLKKLGFSPSILFQDGVEITAKWYDENEKPQSK